MNDSFSSIGRTALSFILLLIISFFFGRQINAHKNHFSMAMAITIGSLVANMGFNINLKFWPMVWSFITTVLIYYLAAISTFRLHFFEKLLSGTPCVLVEDGKIIEKNLNAAKYTTEHLHQQLREKEIFDLSQVKKAILEPSGILSVQKKQPLKRGTIYTGIPNHYINGMALPFEVIAEGVYISKEAGLDLSAWLEGYFAGLNLKPSQIQYAIISSDGRLYATFCENESLNKPGS